MKAGFRPQYYRIRRMVQMVREGAETGYLANSSDFMKEFVVSRRTVARDLDFLRDEERATLAFVTGVLDKALHDGIGLNDAKFIRQYVRDGEGTERRFHRWIESNIAAQVNKPVAKPPLTTAVAEAPVPYINKRMQSKFKSTCVTCGQPISKGEEIIYRKGLGAKHYSCFAQEPLPNGGREDCHGSGEDYPCSDLGYEDACAAACGL